MRAGADVNAVNKYGDTPLIRAAYRGSLATVKVLVAAGADVNYRKNMSVCSSSVNYVV